jgi:hypothetical protein
LRAAAIAAALKSVSRGLREASLPEPTVVKIDAATERVLRYGHPKNNPYAIVIKGLNRQRGRYTCARAEECAKDEGKEEQTKEHA